MLSWVEVEPTECGTLDCIDYFDKLTKPVEKGTVVYLGAPSMQTLALLARVRYTDRVCVDGRVFKPAWTLQEAVVHDLGTSSNSGGKREREN